MRIFLTYTIFLLPFLVSQFANFGAVCGDVLMEKAQKDFAINLLRAATDENGMKACVMSPISVGIALAMTLIGAGGQTEKQMMDVLAKGATKEDAIEYLSRQYNKMIGTNEKYELISADKLLIQKNFNPLPAFTETITSKFGPQLETINFNEARKAAERINEWVANKTNDKLHDLVSPVIFNVLTRLVLLNAIYFKGKWVNTFISEATTPATFYEAKNKERQVSNSVNPRIRGFHAEKVTNSLIERNLSITPSTAFLDEMLYDKCTENLCDALKKERQFFRYAISSI
ncbi:hypothetical protein AB6A40_008673 [Gnathostoma spinigerum]|uniref:Serpin domain-containing protein n=1 Tax=Gnathostoma spinigerum TaxID=75299 RepID=A0ABD6EXI2_9BILA